MFSNNSFVNLLLFVNLSFIYYQGLSQVGLDDFNFKTAISVDF